MSEGYYEKFVKCPFFCREIPNKIVCEGIIQNSVIHFTFIDAKDQKKYLQGVCSNLKGHKVCPIYKMLYQLCEEDGNE